MNLNKIHEDIRGSIHSITGEPIKFEEISFLSTRAGLMRGGCLHKKNSEHLVVIQGQIVYYYRLPGEHIIYKRYMKTGESITIDANVPHYMLSVSDSIIAEWGADIDEKKEKHAEFRVIVEEHNRKQNL